MAKDEMELTAQATRRSSFRRGTVEVKTLVCCSREYSEQLVCQVHVPHRGRLGVLLNTGAGSMASLDEFIKEERLFELFHFGGELARVLGADAIVLSSSKNEWLRIRRAGLQLVIGRNLRQELAFRRYIHRTVLGHPAGAGLDVLETQHIEQRDIDNDRVPQFRALSHFDSNQ